MVDQNEKVQVRPRRGGKGLFARITAAKSRYFAPLLMVIFAFNLLMAQGLCNPDRVFGRNKL